MTRSLVKGKSIVSGRLSIACNIPGAITGLRAAPYLFAVPHQFPEGFFLRAASALRGKIDAPQNIDRHVCQPVVSHTKSLSAPP
jgi:hypothetical protein